MLQHWRLRFAACQKLCRVAASALLLLAETLTPPNSLKFYQSLVCVLAFKHIALGGNIKHIGNIRVSDGRLAIVELQVLLLNVGDVVCFLILSEEMVIGLIF